MIVFWKYVSYNLISFADLLNFIMKVFIALILTGLCCFGCEPFDLDQKNFPICEKPEGAIGYTVSQMEVTFYLENQKGDIGAIGWDLGDGRNRSGSQFTVVYQKPGTYTVSMVLANQCDDRYTATQLVTVSN